MPNRFRYRMTLLELQATHAPSEFLRDMTGTEMVAVLPGRGRVYKFNLIRLSAN